MRFEKAKQEAARLCSQGIDAAFWRFCPGIDGWAVIFDRYTCRTMTELATAQRDLLRPANGVWDMFDHGNNPR